MILVRLIMKIWLQRVAVAVYEERTGNFQGQTDEC